MSPESKQTTPRYPQRDRQSGAALVVAVFIIVVMALLATVIARVISTGAASSVDEIFGTRALQAANSGAQVFALDLIDSLEDDNGDPEQVCSGTIDTLAFNAPGLQNCSSEVSCAVTNYNEFDLTQFRITSAGRCTSANQQYSRVITLEIVDGHF